MSIKLGDTVRDAITGFEGVVIGRTEWLYGCVRCVVQGTKLKDDKPQDPVTIDEPQLVVLAQAGEERTDRVAMTVFGGDAKPPVTGGPRPDAVRR